jgi:uncharacterized membrane protein
MIRGARIVLVAVVIFAIAYVLITPDLTDDVDGVLRPNHQAKAQRLVILSLPQLQVLVIVVFFLSMSSAQRLTTSELLDLVCVCRC